MRGFALGLAVLVGLGSLAAQARADERSPDGVWTVLDSMPAAQQNAPAGVRPNAFRAMRLDRPMLSAELAIIPHERTPEAAHPMRITLPRPDGGFESFDIVEYSMM